MPTVEKLLDLKGFMDAASLGRTTVFELIKDGTLKEGSHFINASKAKKRKNIRFLYPQCLEALVETFKPAAQAAAQDIEKKPARSKPCSNKNGVNLKWRP